ncbi:MAG TPA: GNAT family N-acetyltransferase [Rhodospirillaceae bacterium]|jgi:GNAT superfamily N-acetyltransferase|nr:GNAT family N-acetyltransferase [Alphaproteobacteria bacterium]HBH25991.1 GNAT family N-acetyltransferase [Rhodospirillaceae bacterium]
MTINAKLAIRPPEAADRGQWAALYLAFLGDVATAPARTEVSGRVWGWLLDPAHPLQGLVADVGGGALAGLAHFSPKANPFRGRDIGFLDDLYVAEAHRRQGVATSLLRAVLETTERAGWPVLRWLCGQDNAAGRALYDKIAGAPSHVVYGLPTGPRDAGFADVDCTYKNGWFATFGGTRP